MIENLSRYKYKKSFAAKGNFHFNKFCVIRQNIMLTEFSKLFYCPIRESRLWKRNELLAKLLGLEKFSTFNKFLR